MGTPRGDRSLRWKMPPFFLSDRRRWRDGRTNGVGRQSGSGDVTRTLSLSLSLPLLRGRWNAQISRGRRRRSFVRRCCSIPLEKCPTPFKSQPLCLLRAPDDGERGRGGGGGGGGRRRAPTPFSRSSFMRSAIFRPFIHSFGQSASQPASAVRPHIMVAGAVGRPRRGEQGSATSCCLQSGDLK